MQVSIITVYYNREDRVKESINSLLNQTHTNFEVIAVDDGSTDNTLAVLQSIKDSRLKVITHTNMGFTKSVKKAINIAKSDIIAIHGSGDLSYPERIEKQVKKLQSNNDIGVIGCYVENYNYETKESNILKPYIPKGIPLVEILKKKNLFTHGEVMFRKSIYNKVGGYREFFKYAQDRDLWIRMSLVTKFYIIPEVLYRRYKFSDGVSTSAEKTTMQKIFNEISRQCIELKINGEKDLVERYGMYAGFFRKKSKRLSKELYQISLKEFLNDNLNMSKKILTLSIQENRSIINRLFYFFIVFSNYNKRFHELIKKILRFYINKRQRR